MRTQHTVVTEPAALAVDLETAINHCRVDAQPDIDLIELAYLPAAVRIVEDYLARALITQTLRFTAATQLAASSRVTENAFVSVPLTTNTLIELPRCPVQSVSSVTVSDHDGVSTTLTADTDYVLERSTDPTRIRLLNALSSWRSITVEYVAGYGPSASDIPTPIRQAILLVVNDLYSNRGDAAGDGLSNTVKALLSAYRVAYWG